MKLGVKKILIIAIFGLLLFPGSGYAEQCDMDRLKQLAEQVEVTTEFDEKSADIGISSNNLITVTGITDELYAMTKDKRIIFIYDNREEDGSIKQFVRADGSDEIQIFSTYCSDKPLRTVKVDLKRYNIFSGLDECKGLQDKLDVCSEYYDGELDLDKLSREIEKYNSKIGLNKKNDNNDSLLERYLVWIVLLTVICVAGVVVLIVKKIKESRLD